MVNGALVRRVCHDEKRRAKAEVKKRPCSPPPPEKAIQVTSRTGCGIADARTSYPLTGNFRAIGLWSGLALGARRLVPQTNPDQQTVTPTLTVRVSRSKLMVSMAVKGQ